jgi:homoserine O-acetyltransferase
LTISDQGSNSPVPSSLWGEKGELGLIETKFYTFDGLALESGDWLGPVTLAYETYGVLNHDKSNAILVCHAFSGDAHAAGWHEGDKDPGWWNEMIGPGKAFDTDKYFIICNNVIGGCKGSTGPSSLNPETGQPYGLDFPLITIGDMVECQVRLVTRHLGIEKLLTVSGGSMGGMQVLSWMGRYPDHLKSAIPIATAIKHTPQQIAFDEVGRQAIMADPDWKDGNYYGGNHPAKGLSVARMVGHITYMSDTSMAEKFGRQKKTHSGAEKFTADFEVEGYLRYRGENFVKRFDANSYLYITKAMDNFDAAAGRPFPEALRGRDLNVLVIGFKSDWLYPLYQSQEIVKACKLAGLEATYCEIESTYGHDAFLMEVEEETHLIKHFLRKIYNGYEVTDES